MAAFKCLGWRKLAVTVSVQITNILPDRTLYVGSNVTFAVTANGSLPLGFQWCKDGAPLLGATNSPLSISSVRLADAGGYSLVAGNIGGFSTSAVATLTVVLRTNLFSGAEVVWARQAGGTNEDRGQGVAVDSSGNVFVADVFGDTFGQRPSTDAGTFGTNTLAGLGNSDIFVAKLSGVPHRPLRIHTLAQQSGATARLVFGHDDHSPLDVSRRRG